VHTGSSSDRNLVGWTTFGATQSSDFVGFLLGWTILVGAFFFLFEQSW
jgi:hypothetical protein